MSTETTLLPCPFCAGEASIEEWEDGESEFSVGCNDAGCLGHETLECRFETPEIATNTWNRRALQPKVVAKPIEWEELNARGDKNHRFSKELRYAIEHKQDGTFYAFVCLGLEIGLFSTEAEAISACQAIEQDKVDRFLLDCDIVITPQP